MAKKIYRPTEEQLARYAQEMQRWEDAHLVNKDYWDNITQRLEDLEARTGRATLDDMRHFMHEKGNEEYFKAFQSYLDVTKKETPFTVYVGREMLGHELLHFFLRTGHTPEQEQFLLAAAEGYEHKPEQKRSWFKNYAKQVEHELSDGFQNGVERDQPLYKEGVAHRLPVPEKRDTAIYYAAGLYLNYKVGWFFNHAGARLDYASQRKLIEHYNNPASDEIPVGAKKYASEELHAVPYQFGLLSDQEWRQIISVATGLKQPDDTLFPKRMDAIQKGLMEAGLYEDKRTQVGEALKHYSEQHPKKGTFDPEKFKAARAKRGVDEPGRG